MEIITSNKNSIVLRTIDIKNNKEDGLFIEGIKLLKEAILSGCIVKYCLIEQSYISKALQMLPELEQSTYYIVSSTVLQKVSDTKTPQGIVSVVNFELNNKNKLSGNFVVLDCLQDPGNLGTIIRSSCGTSFNSIVLIGGVSPLSQKVVRSSMGGIFKVKFYSFADQEAFLQYAKENHLMFYSATMEGKNVFEFDAPKYGFGIVIGNEGAGVSNIFKENCSGLLSIPMKNNLESLNAGVSASIIMYVLDNKL